MASHRILNVNVGLMGHVDSGKTSIARALSTHLSTASLDKSPTSQARGITLDLGFSAFRVHLPHHLATLPYDEVQFTLVDCPGHASLIRTIIGGASIIDLMLLVIDVNKGIQTQTSECIVIGEIMKRQSVVVLNKIDLLPRESSHQQIDKMRNRLKKTFENTTFEGAPIVAVSAAPKEGSPNVRELIETLSGLLQLPQRSKDGPLLFEFDHCFQIKSQGTILTGTILRGSLKINQTIEIPALKQQRKVKSMQMFHLPISEATQGDRLGICVTQLDPRLLERGIVCEPGSVVTLFAAVVSANRVRYFKNDIKSKTQFHVTIGHTTAMATVQFFGTPKGRPKVNSDGQLVSNSSTKFDGTVDYEYREALYNTDEETPSGSQYALLIFDTPIITSLNSMFIAARLDADETLHKQLHIYKTKVKVGTIERVYDCHTLIGGNLFKRETDISVFINLRITKQNGVYISALLVGKKSTKVGFLIKKIRLKFQHEFC